MTRLTTNQLEVARVTMDQALTDDAYADEAAVELLEAIPQSIGHLVDQLDGYVEGKGLLLAKGGTESGELWLTLSRQYIVVRKLGKGAEQHMCIGARQVVHDWTASAVIAKVTAALIHVEDWSTTARYRRVAFRAAADLLASIPE